MTRLLTAACATRAVLCACVVACAMPALAQDDNAAAPASPAMGVIPIDIGSEILEDEPEAPAPTVIDAPTGNVAPALARPPPRPIGRDKPNDGGGAIIVEWQPSPDDGAGESIVTSYAISCYNSMEGGMATVSGEIGVHPMTDAERVDPVKYPYRIELAPVKDGAHYYCAVAAVSGGPPIESPRTGPIIAEPSFFNPNRFNALLFVALVVALIWYFLKKAEREGESMYVRRIPGIDAIEEAIGRATEMGKPVLYVPGIQDMTNIQTIASMLILGKVAEKIAEYQASVIVPNMIPFVREVAAEVVQQGYYNAGDPDSFNPESVMFLSNEQFAFTAGVNGLILREQPAANLYLGCFFAESLLLAETGFAAKSIQVAGTAEFTQLPFFIAACDYTLIGEELFAASAYLSKDPKVLSTLKAADWSKIIFIGVLLTGVLLETFGVLPGFKTFFEYM